MPDKHNILAKYFLNEPSENDEGEIAEFKKNNPREYGILAALWKKGNVESKDFDSHEAWSNLKNKTTDKNKNQVKIIPLYQKIRRYAAVAIFLIIGAFSVYYYISFISESRTVVEQANNTDKGKEILLSDGSKVWLNKNATLTFSKKFSKTERTVTLTGEAFFEVVKNPDKPFIVTTSNSSIRVLGTSFNINSNIEKTEVTVVTGKVKVSDTNHNNVIITPGYSANITKNIVKKHKTKNPNYLSWKTGEFTFKNTNFKQVIKDLNSYYQEQIIIEQGTTIDCRLTANFNQAKLQEIIDVMQLTCDFSVEVNANNYILK